jgi:hypothetical protein
MFNIKIELKNTKKTISLMKLVIMVNYNIKEIITMPQKDLKDLIMKKCCYEKRNDRINMTDLYKNNKS